MAENSISDGNSFIDREIELDCKQVSKIFKKIKDKGILNENIHYDDYIEPSKELLYSKDFMDVIKYYRLLKRKTKSEIAIKVGIDDETYREYEIKKNEIQDWKIADKLIKALEIENEVKLPDYFKIKRSYPLDKVKEIIDKEGKKNFSKETGISIQTINSWNQKNAPKSLSTYTYKRMQDFFKNHKIPY